MSIIIKVEAKESALRTKIKKLTQAKSKLNTAVENLRQENVDLSAERDSSEMQLKHLNGVSGDRGKSLEAAKSEELKLKAELAQRRLVMPVWQRSTEICKQARAVGDQVVVSQ